MPRSTNEVPAASLVIPESAFNNPVELESFLGRSIPPHLSVHEMQLPDDPEAEEKFAQNVSAIALLDALAAREDVVANPDSVNAIIDAITVNAAYAASVDYMPLTTPGQCTAQLNTFDRYPAVIERRPDRVIALLGGIKRHNPDAYNMAYEIAALCMIDEMHSPSHKGSLGQKQLGGRIDVVVAVEAASGVAPDEALAALQQCGNEMMNLFNRLRQRKPDS